MGRKEEGSIDVIIETPKGSRNKYAWEDERQAFRLKKLLPAGMVFPFDFGFIPGTRGEDGDPVDVLVLLDEPAYPGVIVEARIIGALKAVQSKGGAMLRNDRLIAVSVLSRAYGTLRNIQDLGAPILEEISHFFISYNKGAGRVFEPQGWADRDEAKGLIDSAR